MKRIGVVSYNIHGNFTNYGSALQSWALTQAINKVGNGDYASVLVDYCPDILANMDPLNPFKDMWDQDEESRKMCELSLPAIRENYKKFDRFYHEEFMRTKGAYTSENFNEIINNECLDGFVCGSDTIFCMDEFGFDDGFYANYGCMRRKSVSYAASFGDPSLTEENCKILNNRLQNFLSLGIRENMMVPYLKNHCNVPVQRVLDPTLLLTQEDYEKIATKDRLEEQKYLLYYSRRYSPKMEAYAEKLAKANGWKIVEISLRATNKDKGHRMFYEAGVEEFLSLVKNAEYVVTNSFHGMIFSVQYRKPFVIFTREQCNTKIDELLLLFGLKDHMLISGDETFDHEIDYDKVHERIQKARVESSNFLKMELSLL